MRVELKSITPNAEVNIVEIARVSSSRTDKTEAPDGLIKYLIKNKHWSPFQHSYLTFEIITSKSIGIQLLRHLSFTFQEFSQRYAKVENFEPIEFRWQAEKNRQSSTDEVAIVRIDENIITVLFADFQYTTGEIAEYMNEVGDYLMRGKKLYEKGLNLGLAKECVRMILPMTSQTTIYMTGNIRSWLSFLNLRLDSHAQKEAVLIAKEVALIMQKELPIITKATNNFGNFEGMFM